MLDEDQQIGVKNLEIVNTVDFMDLFDLHFNGLFETLERMFVCIHLVVMAVGVGKDHPSERFKHFVVPFVDMSIRGGAAFIFLARPCSFSGLTGHIIYILVG